ncbi:hypothetical protein TYRP_005264 [Tyrophagus putrescentiae]|nr:hypothetical protein TYRP_005264 [Tyrophagus putrescentiae]
MRPPSFWLEGRSTPEAARLVREAEMPVIGMSEECDTGGGGHDVDESSMLWSSDSGICERWVSLPFASGNTTLAGLIDTGITVNLMPEQIAREMQITPYASAESLVVSTEVPFTFQAVKLAITIGEIQKEVEFQLHVSIDRLITFGVGVFVDFKLEANCNGGVSQTVMPFHSRPLNTFSVRAMIDAPMDLEGTFQPPSDAQQPRRGRLKRAREERESGEFPPTKIYVEEKADQRESSIFVSPTFPSSNGAVEALNRIIAGRFRPPDTNNPEGARSRFYPGLSICPVIPQRAEDQLSERPGMRLGDHAEPMAN